MRKRSFYVLLCILSLGFGGLIYVFFRPNTIVSGTAVSIFPFLEGLRKAYQDVNCDFIKYYFPDFLWAFSLFCGLNAIFNSHEKTRTNAIIVLFLGIGWEIGQHFEIFTGTGDLLDILTYSAAVITVVFVEKHIKKE